MTIFDISKSISCGIYSRVDRLCTTTYTCSEVPVITISSSKDNDKFLWIPFEVILLLIVKWREQQKRSFVETDICVTNSSCSSR